MRNPGLGIFINLPRIGLLGHRNRLYGIGSDLESYGFWGCYLGYMHLS